MCQGGTIQYFRKSTMRQLASRHAPERSFQTRMQIQLQPSSLTFRRVTGKWATSRSIDLRGHERWHEGRGQEGCTNQNFDTPHLDR